MQLITLLVGGFHHSERMYGDFSHLIPLAENFMAVAAIFKPHFYLHKQSLSPLT